MNEITLSNGMTTIVDECDYIWASTCKWCVCDKGNKTEKLYAERRKNNKNSFLHREILSAPKGLEVDHINGNTLDNRRCNLRLCTHQENCSNQQPQKKTKHSRFKGVTKRTQRYLKKTNEVSEYVRWRAYIVKNNTQISLGFFDTEIEAAKAYNEAALLYHGAFARLNDV